jgi:hypothetical protein
MNSNLLNYFEESSIAFLKVPKFLRILVTPQGAELYALLRERRKWLIDIKKIRNHDSWFFYPTKDLQHDLQPPNSPNHLKSLLDKLEALMLIETRVVKFPSTIKYYRIKDDMYLQIAKEEANNWVRKKGKEFDQLQEESNHGEPLGYEG